MVIALAYLALKVPSALQVNLLNLLLGAAAAVAIAAPLIALGRAWNRRGKMTDQFYRDFYGDTRAGVPSTPGVRVMLEDLSRDISSIVAEITPNGGGSIKDAVSRMEKKIGTMESDVKGLHDLLDKGS